MFSSCCPKVVPLKKITKEHTDTITIIRPDTLYLPVDEVYDFNFNTLCDSLWRARQDGTKIVLTKKVHSKSVSVHLDSTGIGKIICHDDSLMAIIQSKETTINKLKETATVQTINVCENWFHKFAVWWFGITSAFIAGIMFLKLKKP